MGRKCKLSAFQRAEIKRLKAEGMTQARLGEIFGVGQATIGRVLHTSIAERARAEIRRDLIIHEPRQMSLAEARLRVDQAKIIRARRDQRDLTARLLGDPPPERSALAARAG